MNTLEKIYLKSPIAVQNLFCTLHGLREYPIRYKGKFEIILKWLKESQWWSEDQLIEYQKNKLHNILKIAYDQIPFYKKRFSDAGLKPEDIKSIEDFKKFPLLTKEDVFAAGESIINPKYKKPKLVAGHTSGTTGSALHLFYTKECVQFQWAVWLRHRARFGIKLGDRRASFGGRLIAPFQQEIPPFWRENRVFNQTVFSQYHMKPELIGTYIDRLNQEPYDYYDAYPSTIYLLASFLEDSGRQLKYRPRAVFTSSETLLEHQKRLITKHIGKPSEVYGCGEYCGAASQCEEGYYHVDAEFGLIEIIPLQDVEQKEGEVVGKVVMTGFANPAMPFIRYDVGDVVTYLPNFKCSCGRASIVLKHVDGRLESYLITGDGRKIGRLDHIFKDMLWVKESQFIQNRHGEVVIKLIPRREYSQKDIAFLLSECEVRMGKEMKINLEFVESIPRSSSGKFRAVISNI